MKRLFLNAGLAQRSFYDLIAVPAMLASGPGLTSETLGDRTVILHIDPSIAEMLGIVLAFPLSLSKTMGTVHNHRLLVSVYAGFCLPNASVLRDVLIAADRDYREQRADANTIAYVLSKSKAIELELFTENSLIDDDQVFVIAHGTSAEVIADMFDSVTADHLHPRDVASFLVGDKISSPTKTAIGTTDGAVKRSARH